MFLLLSTEVSEHSAQFDKLTSFCCFEAAQWPDTCHDDSGLTHADHNGLVAGVVLTMA